MDSAAGGLPPASCVCETSIVKVNVSHFLNASSRVDFGYDEGDGDLIVSCPHYNACCGQVLEQLGFWLEGVVQTTFAVAGILVNLVSSLILASKEMRNAFNLLLIALAFFDSCYLFGSILESFRKSFHMVTRIHTLLFPYLLYPGQMIMMTASVFMTVAIAMERYWAVHYPLDYNFAMNDESASFRRLLKYVIPVITFAFTFNIPKFMEAEINYDEESGEPMLGPSNLRIDPNYTIYYNNWARIAVLGVIPTVMLVFFNTKIYQDIRIRRARRRPQRGAVTFINQDDKTHVQPRPPPPAIAINDQNPGNPNGHPTAVLTDSKANGDGTRQDLNQNSGERKEEEAAAATNNHSNGGAEEQSQALLNSKSNPQIRISATAASPAAAAAAAPTPPAPSAKARILSLPQSIRRHSQRKLGGAGGGGTGGTAGSVNRRRVEDNLAMIFMGIVLVFLLCHLPRIFLGIHEMLIVKQSLACKTARQDPFPWWSLVVGHFSHLLLVLNCSANSLIYCMLSSKFRVVAVKVYNNLVDNLNAFFASSNNNNATSGGNRSTSSISNNNGGGGGRRGGGGSPQQQQQAAAATTAVTAAAATTAVNCDERTNKLTTQLVARPVVASSGMSMTSPAAGKVAAAEDIELNGDVIDRGEDELMTHAGLNDEHSFNEIRHTLSSQAATATSTKV